MQFRGSDSKTCFFSETVWRERGEEPDPALELQLLGKLSTLRRLRLLVHLKLNHDNDLRLERDSSLQPHGRDEEKELSQLRGCDDHSQVAVQMSMIGGQIHFRGALVQVLSCHHFSLDRFINYSD